MFRIVLAYLDRYTLKLFDEDIFQENASSILEIMGNSITPKYN